jgi:hypothetical protein
VLDPTSLAFRDVASKKDNDGMKIGARQHTRPVLRVAGTCHAQDFRSSSYALAKFFWKTGEGVIV